MKLFSFKSLCLRWRGELIDNANVPVGLGEEGEGGEEASQSRGDLVQVFNFLKPYVETEVMSFIPGNLESVASVIPIS